MMAFNNDEARFLRQPVTLFCSYLESNYFREQREKKQKRELQKGNKGGFEKGPIKLPLDLSQLKILFGKTNFD